MLFAKRLFNDGHTREFVVDDERGNGWEVREAQDNHIVRRTLLHDWHRVESTIMRFGIEATQLERKGWIELQSPASSVV
jgi:hypothetical protein